MAFVRETMAGVAPRRGIRRGSRVWPHGLDGRLLGW